MFLYCYYFFVPQSHPQPEFVFCYCVNKVFKKTLEIIMELIKTSRPQKWNILTFIEVRFIGVYKCLCFWVKVKIKSKTQKHFLPKTASVILCSSDHPISSFCIHLTSLFTPASVLRKLSCLNKILHLGSVTLSGTCSGISLPNISV